MFTQSVLKGAKLPLFSNYLKMKHLLHFKNSYFHSSNKHTHIYCYNMIYSPPSSNSMYILNSSCISCDYMYIVYCEATNHLRFKKKLVFFIVFEKYCNLFTYCIQIAQGVDTISSAIQKYIGRYSIFQ